MKFADISGHDDVKDRLRRMVDDRRLPHALLLEGPAGVGKMMLARALAQYIHCTDRRDGDSCGRCPHCIQHQSFNNIDTFFSFPVIKRGSGKPSLSKDFYTEFTAFMDESPLMDMERWLEKLDNVNARPSIYVEEGEELTRAMSLTAQTSEHKIVLMWLPERMQEAAANKLLKLVEEPFPDTLFIMVSNQPRGILPTIYSRVQRVDVKRFSTDVLGALLRDSYGMQPSVADEASRLGEGSILGALKAAEETRDAAANLQAFKRVMRAAFRRDLSDMKAWAADLASLGREGAVRFLRYAQHMVRENFVLALRRDDLQRLNAEEAAFSGNFSPYINERNADEIVHYLDTAVRDIQGNANAKIVFFDTALKLAMLIKR